MAVPELRFKNNNGQNFSAWEENNLGDVSQITMGQSPDSNSYNSKGQGVYLIQGNADIKNGLSNPRNWTTEPTKICNYGDVLLTVRAPIGSVAKSIHKACIGRGMCAIKNNNHSDIDFIYQFLLHNEIQWVRYGQGSTFAAISGKDIKSFKINIPSLPEQQKIASFLTAVDKRISLLQRKATLLEAYKKGVMQKLFSQQLRFKDGNGQDFPDWEEKKLGEVFKISAGGDIKRENVSKKKNEIFKYPIYANSEKNRGLYGYSDLFKIDYECITVTGRGSLGVANARKEKFYPIVRLLILKPKDNCDVTFFENLINQLNFFHESTGVPQLTGPQISTYKVKFPNYREQQKIASFLESLDKKIATVNQQIEGMQSFKKGLLQQMFV